MPTRPAPAPATQRTPAPGYCSEPARTPTTPRVYLCASGAGRGRRSRTSSSCSAVTAGSGRSRPMSTRCTTPQAIAAGSTRCATLWVPNVTVTVARTCAPSTWPVSTSTPDGVSTATTGTPSSAATTAAASSRRPPLPPDADDPVDHHVGAGGLLHRADHPAADGEQRREARRVDPVGAQQQGLAPARHAGRAAPRRTARHRRCCPRRPAAARGRRTRGRAGRGRRTPARRRPAA